MRCSSTIPSLNFPLAGLWGSPPHWFQDAHPKLHYSLPLGFVPIPELTSPNGANNIAPLGLVSLLWTGAVVDFAVSRTQLVLKYEILDSTIRSGMWKMKFFLYGPGLQGQQFLAPGSSIFKSQVSPCRLAVTIGSQCNRHWCRHLGWDSKIFSVFEA